jgi:predicted extracellular nuclease
LWIFVSLAVDFFLRDSQLPGAAELFSLATDPGGFMQRLLMILFLVFCLAGAAQAQTSDLFISEYIEGSGYNKAVEIFNGTADPIDISDYTLDRYSNGAAIPLSIPLIGGEIPPGEVFVIANPSADAGIVALADQTSAEINFNGDDALVLRQGIHTVDCFGQIGVDPGSAWTCPGGTTVNATLVRIPSFCVGDQDPADPFDPCESFTFESTDSFGNLGQHLTDCTSVAEESRSWGTLKALYR